VYVGRSARLGRPHRLAPLRHHHALPGGPAGTRGPERVCAPEGHRNSAAG